jgi:hypothetical protein
MKSGSGELIGACAIVAILLSFAFLLAGPGTTIEKAWTEALNAPSTTQQQVQAPAPASGNSVVGGPSLSAQKINSILCGSGSPACGDGNIFYQDSQQYNIDDADALAFFHHESSFGTAGAAVETRNVGNIVCTAGYNCIGRFRAYSSWAEGIDDWYRLMAGPGYVGGGLTTLNQIIPVYAPSSDGNSPNEYIQAVESDVQSWRAA